MSESFNKNRKPMKIVSDDGEQEHCSSCEGMPKIRCTDIENNLWKYQWVGTAYGDCCSDGCAMSTIYKNEMKETLHVKRLETIIVNREKTFTGSSKTIGQDFIIKGICFPNNLSEFDYKLDKPFTWLLCADGNGNDDVIDYLRKISWHHFVSNHHKNLIHDINKDIMENSINTIRSGSTLTFIKIYKEEVIISWVGDSCARIYKNNKLFSVTKAHNYDNPFEKVRIDSIPKNNYYALGSMSVTKYDNTLSVVNDDTITMKQNTRVLVPQTACYLAMSRFIGYGNAHPLMKTPESLTINYNSKDNIKIVMGSDGVWDMINDNIEHTYDNEKLLFMNASDIMDMIMRRWNMDWKYQWDDGSGKITTSIEKIPAIDDVCVGVWSNYNYQSFHSTSEDSLYAL